MEIKQSERSFVYNKIPLKDPDPKMTVAQVREFYSNIYTEITTAEIEGPEQKDNKLVYTFRRAVGTKGVGPVDFSQLYSCGIGVGIAIGIAVALVIFGAIFGIVWLTKHLVWIA